MKSFQGLIKIAQDIEDNLAPPDTNTVDSGPKRKAPGHSEPTMEAYPDYGKSLVHQTKRDPHTAGLLRGIGTGLTGAAAGALIARMLTKNPLAITGMAGLAGGAAGMLGYDSGKREADSDYSRILFLRRKLGINDPGELETLLKNPELLERITSRKSRVKVAAKLPSGLLKELGIVGGAGAAGYLLGDQGTSRFLDYHDDPGARHTGAMLNAGELAILVAMKRKGIPIPKLAPAAVLGSELIPKAFKSQGQAAAASKAQAEASKSTAEAASEAAKNQIGPSIARALSSPTAAGAGIGAGAAGLAALASGLLRAKPEEEQRKGRTRAGMIARDFGKYVIPASVLGGVLGSMKKAS